MSGGKSGLEAMQLLVLAAGSGSRFGGAKQWTMIPGAGRTLLEFSVAHAVDAGFRRVVLVVSEAVELKTTQAIARRLPQGVRVEWCPQRPSDLPAKAPRNGDRQKPWGTGHAAWVARGAIDGPFVLINADDYYGPRVFERLAAHLRAAPGWAVAAFRLADTLTPHGPVNRALCDVGAGNRLEDLREWTSIRCDGRRLLGTGPDGKTVALDSDRRVSMNAWALRPDVFPVLELGLVEFLSGRPGGPDEYHLPDAIARAVRSGARSVSVIDAGERWLGITYPEDIERIAQTLSEQS